MPTPVDVARQCLTSEAAHALDEAVAVTRRRGHAQTTSLHAISALLSLPSSILRDACGRARNVAYSPRLQFKALELCLSVSLDRVPSTTTTQLTESPPVSNSLMAAIKRSQAKQRRLPENYHHLYNQNPQTSSISCVKVELQHLIISILDDPVVSRVFGEAGFRSSEIKLAIIRPLPKLIRYNNGSYNYPRRSPLFLCNFTENQNLISDMGHMPRGGSGFPVGGLFKDGEEEMAITSSTNRPSSLTESFVPFGGFFPTTCELKSPALSNNSSYQGATTRCHLCNEKCEQELVAVSNGIYSASVADQYQSCLPSWLQMTELGSLNDGLDPKTGDDGVVLSAKVVGLRNKWDKICSRLHHRQPFNNAYQAGFQFQTTVGCQDKSEPPTKKNCVDPNSQTATTSRSLSADSSVDDGNKKSPTLIITSVTTDLGLGISDNNQTHSSSSSCLDSIEQQHNSSNFKALFKALSERVNWQDEAISVISQTIATNQMTREKVRGRNSRKGMWFNFTGPDRHGKREIAVSLAEIICGSKHNFIYADLAVANQQVASFRGKTVVDYVAEELRKKPLSIVFLENVGKADVLAKGSISRAIETGKFSDSHGREISINNAILIVATSEVAKRATMNLDLNLPASEDDGNCEDRNGTMSWLQDFSDQMVRTVVFKPRFESAQQDQTSEICFPRKIFVN